MQAKGGKKDGGGGCRVVPSVFIVLKRWLNFFNPACFHKLLTCTKICNVDRIREYQVNAGLKPVTFRTKQDKMLTLAQNFRTEQNIRIPFRILFRTFLTLYEHFYIVEIFHTL